MSNELKKDFDFFISNHSDMVKKYLGRVVVIADEKVYGDFSTELDALTAVRGKLAPGSFLVQRVKDAPDEYTQTFHSRVAFA
jgi:hypothetical protein